MIRTVVLSIAALALCHSAAAQEPVADPNLAVPFEGPATPWITVRFHAGPNLNLMGDWRDGLGALRDRARDGGLQPTDQSCICMSWGTAAVAHVSARFALGGQFEMLRDTRRFSVNDHVQLLGQNASFGFGNETVVRTSQVLVAMYPRQRSRMHVQVGGGLGTGHTELSTPGGGASGRVRGALFSASVGMESRFWYADGGWRFHRMRVTDVAAYDHTVNEARDVFQSEADVRNFVQDRAVDFTGGWVRFGLAFHFGRR